MYQIALCDDEIMELDKVEEMLESYRKQQNGYDFSIRRFTHADGLLQFVRGEGYVPDLIIMDIYMPGKMGIEAAKELREMGNECRIIFLTTSREYALEAFRVDAGQYLVKPVMEEEMFPVLDKLLQQVDREQKKYVPFRIHDRIHRVSVHDIVFCEAQKKCQYMYLSDGTQYVLRMTMARIYDMLCGYPEFVKVGISYIANLDHIESLNARELQMDNGEKIYLPRGSYQPLRERYFDYYCEEETGCKAYPQKCE